ncbi:MAG: hypothetical protein ABSG95_13620 [Solirubrobacteraceae bacterium]|jgi:hypothetical protein
MPAEPNDWTWNEGKQELVCPACEIPDERRELLGTIRLTTASELEQDVLAGADAQTLEEAEVLRRLTSGEDGA